MRRSLIALLALLVGACGGAPVAAFPADTPDDLRALSEEVFASVAAALPAQAECLDGLRIEGAWELDDRARYFPAEARLVVRIPATAPQLTVSLVHEIGHHLDTVCGDDGLRAEFMQAQGHPPDTAWEEGVTWEDTPAEQFATAVVVAVTGRPDNLRPIRLGPEALTVVAAWGSGEEVTHEPSVP